MADEQTLFGYVWSAVTTVGLFVLGLLHAGHRREMDGVKSMAQKANDDLAAHKLHAAENFATRADVEKLGDRIEERFDKLERKLDDERERNQQRPN